jgi:transcriptional regulator with XRE-family HTH domain
MTEHSARLTDRTVLRPLTLVNSVVTVSTENPDTPGSRLRDYIDARWTRRQGGKLGLARKLNVSTETMYAWFRDDGHPPNLDHLARLAEALKVSRSEILAAMDGEAPAVRLDHRFREAIEAAVEAALDERLGPRREPRERSGAA